ncbi:DUF4142 domain-containing protein [Streptomyces sp. P1-3]|uniref:DUF4142 domain-containing protein n=1 Tax=Streptomyces sp. P1-3 TaxID=3421658 RepID=UPI003D36D566
MRPGLRRLVLGGTVESRHMLATTLVVGALTATFVALLIPVQLFGRGGAAAAGPAAGEDDGRGVMSTQYGPLTPLDREFVRKVRLAGLWELPAGRQAQQRGTTPAVRTAGEHLVEGHTELDRLVIQVGRDVGVDLANQPTEEQQGWLAQLEAARGREYDRLFANLLRKAHGKVFSLVAQIRANSRNSMVRSLATRANTVVLDHITVLEDTGFVDFDALTDGTHPSH